MASEYKLHKPFTLATLPRPLDHTEGRISVGEVYGRREAQKTRKRTELVVGVDGENASLYDVAAARLITSYPIPPQESFTCPPYSLRVRQSGQIEASRYTLIATKSAEGHKITLFKDVIHTDGKTISTSVSQSLPTSPVKYMTVSAATEQSLGIGNIVAVCQNGEFVCLASETLAIHWTASAESAVQDAIASTIDDFQVEHVSSASVSDFSTGMFKNRLEVFAALPKALDPDSPLLALVAQSSSRGQQSRHLIIVAAGASSSESDVQRLAPLEVTPVPSAVQREGSEPSFQVDAQSGLLLELHDGLLRVFNVVGPVPKLKSTVQMDDAVTFTRLARPFIMSCSSESVGLFNYQYRSIHARSNLDLSDLPSTVEQPQTIQLISYFRKQNLVVALIDNVLASIQVEPPKSHGKRRKEGLLIDSICRGTVAEIPNKKRKRETESKAFSKHILGTMTESYLAEYQAAVEVADALLAENQIGQWEEVLRNHFSISLHEEQGLPNGGSDSVVETDAQYVPEWSWLPESTAYPGVDRRWVIYAISQVFTLESAVGSDGAERLHLRLLLPEGNVTTYLAVAGHLTLSNLKSAFRDELSGEAAEDKHLAGDLAHCLTQAEPSMTLLLNYLQATRLGEVEVLTALRAFMQSMDLIPDADKLTSTARLLKNAPHHEGEAGYEMDLDDLEREIALTEHYLGDDNSSRSRGLTLAFTKLWRLPARSTVKSMRSTLSTQEVISLIYLLRVELVRGAWTSLYVDPTSFESEGHDPPPDGIVALISDLLGRCIDAVGSGGWLFNDSMVWSTAGEGSPDAMGEAGDFITALKLEVTAALEGIEEAVYLTGVVGESARYLSAAHKSGAARQQATGDKVNGAMSKPLTMTPETAESRLLPLGFKAKGGISQSKVVSGGEVVQRSMRETGHLISQQVAAYSLEKLVV